MCVCVLNMLWNILCTDFDMQGIFYVSCFVYSSITLRRMYTAPDDSALGVFVCTQCIALRLYMYTVMSHLFSMLLFVSFANYLYQKSALQARASVVTEHGILDVYIHCESSSVKTLSVLFIKSRRRAVKFFRYICCPVKMILPVDEFSKIWIFVHKLFNDSKHVWITVAWNLLFLHCYCNVCT